MFRILAVAFFALVAASTVAGYVVPRRAPPPGWLTDILEPYVKYHTRYLALDCQDKHNTPFFDTCCHPLLAGEPLSALPQECTPSTTKMSSAISAEPTSTVTTPDDDPCDDDDETSSVPAPSSVPAKVTPIAPVTTSAAPTTVVAGGVEAPPPTSATPTATATPTVTPSSHARYSATFFYQEGAPGACGVVHSDNDLIAAIDQARYGNSGNASPLCNKKVQITNKDNGKSVVVTIVDDCPGCKNSDSIDLSTGAFNAIADPATGVVPISWFFLD
ncbi:barwin-like endoglucanase [Artomyces pyxidatus]|uniref:Barwin-like endoglucanase n=1 Tax=Artomyces pyxidatus TaxID=48021 RepID=A0ACB8TBJ3_9AGAM|nr:barwin-like endoglucanase [Artomyces pyxidatus]